MSVRFVDPNTNETLYPGPLEEALSAVTLDPEGDARPVAAIVLNPLLAPATISWEIDVSRPFEAEHWPQAERDKLTQSATRPPDRQLDIQSPHLPWRIEVQARTPNLFVTVLDVLVAIQAALKLEITPEEWDLFGHARRCSTIATRGVRVENYYDSARRVDEMYRHPRRIDSLGEFTRFAGLVPAPGPSPTSFSLKLKRWR